MAVAIHYLTSLWASLFNRIRCKTKKVIVEEKPIAYYGECEEIEESRCLLCNLIAHFALNMNASHVTYRPTIWTVQL